MAGKILLPWKHQVKMSYEIVARYILGKVVKFDGV